MAHQKITILDNSHNFSLQSLKTPIVDISEASRCSAHLKCLTNCPVPCLKSYCPVEQYRKLSQTTSAALVNYHNFSLSQVQCPPTISLPHASDQTSAAHVNHHSFGLSPAQCHMPSEARVHNTYIVNISPCHHECR